MHGNPVEDTPRSVTPWLASLLLKWGESILSRLARFLQQLARLPRWLRRRVERKLLATVVGGSLMLALAWSGSLAEAPAGAALSGSQTQNDKPNIVVIMTDDQDMDSLTSGDGDCVPAMRKLMSHPEGSWVNFTEAHASYSLCSPSRASFLTGQYAYHHGVVDNNSGSALNQYNTLNVWLQKAGYRTGTVGKHNWWIGWDYGSGDVGTVDDQTALALNFMNAPSDKPFFLWLAYGAPHNPAQIPPRYADTNVCIPPDRPNFNEADVSDQPWWIKSQPLISAEELDYIRTERPASQRELLAVDDGVEQVIATLIANGELDNTMIIFVADNGYSWGSHRHTGKTCEMDECTNVPLLIRYPERTDNAVVTTHVSNVDITATIVDYAGISPGLPLDGATLLPLLENPNSPRSDTVFLERPIQAWYYGITNSDWKYVERNLGVIQLYDLNADPYEMSNVANKPAYQAIQSQLAQELAPFKPDSTMTPTPTQTLAPTPTATATATPTATPTATGTAEPSSFMLKLPVILGE